MLKWFKRKNNNHSGKKDTLKFVDVDGQPLAEGDIVESLRYDLGRCRIVSGEHGYEYESLETGARVSYAKMIDAATSFQKVRKVLE